MLAGRASRVTGLPSMVVVNFTLISNTASVSVPVPESTSVPHFCPVPIDAGTATTPAGSPSTVIASGPLKPF